MRKEHKPQLINNPFFSISDLKKATTTSLFERFCLWFIDEQNTVNEEEGHTMIYKMFKGKMYIIHHWINPPRYYNCRCQVIFKT